MSIFLNGIENGLLYFRGNIKEAYLGKDLVYSRTPGIATATITYNVDSGESYTEKIELDQTILSPSTFVPTKTGYDFVGWREDSEASEYVLTESYATEKKTLYAVFKKVVTVTYNANGGSGTTADSTGNLYYNNGKVQEAKITLRRNAFTYSGKSFLKWAKGSASGEQFASDEVITLDIDTVFYAVWGVQELTNKLWKSGSGAGEWTGSYDLTGYSTATVRLVFNKCYVSKLKAISPVSARDQGSTECEITFVPKSGTQTFEWEGTDRPEYGIESSSMTWKIYITAK